MSEELDQNVNEEHKHTITPINGLYENWFLDYASYVILDRAVPHINDGLKPVQRRIMHSLKEMDDGRFNKAANVIGNTMKYHPHGDASIGDAMVQIGQKDLLIDMQGNWGDPITGDSAAAPRYIEARLSKFANDVVFNPDTTEWQLSYDGRNNEPITLPVKFPLLLAQGAEGIAVGLATKVMPHNFIELLDASIEALKGVRPNILPDFFTGGMADFSNYNEGQRGGKIRVRAKITEKDKKTLVITEVPFSTTTGSVIDSILSANDKGKIKIKKIEDNTAANVEIVVHLAPGISPDVTIDALYAFTACEVSISPNTCIIQGDKPLFLSVNDILIENTKHTKNLLKRELEIRLHELQEKIFFSSLLKIFIQEGMYKNPEYENSTNFDTVVEVLHILFDPFKPSLYREILPEDFKKLIDKPMSSITRFDVKKADEQMKNLEDEIKVVKNHLKHLTDYAIAWYQKLKDKYGKGRERKTEIRLFDRVEASKVALANVKLYMNAEDGFIGTGSGLRKDKHVADCSDIDEVIVFREDGKCIITKVAEKTFVGKNIIHAQVFKKNDERTIYNMVYKDGASGTSYIKRFAVVGVTRDKEYDLTKGSKGSKVLYFTANPNGEAEVVNVALKPHSKLRKLQFDQDFAEVAIKGRGSQGNIISKYPVKKIILKSKGVSTLSGLKIWYDDLLKRLNVDGRGKYLGEFDGDDRILQVHKDGFYELSSFELSNHFDDGLILIQKFDPEKIFAAVHFEGKAQNYFIKRFAFELQANGRKTIFISEEQKSRLLFLTSNPGAKIIVDVLKGKTQIPETLDLTLAELIDVKGLKANGNRLSPHDVQKVVLEEPEIEIEAVEEATIDEEEGAEEALDEVVTNEKAIANEETVTEPEVPEEVIDKPVVAQPKPKFERKEEPQEVPVVKPEKPEVKEKPVTVEKPLVEKSKPEAEPVKKEVKTGDKPEAEEKPAKKIDFEITNPDDIDIDDKGQLGLF
ncbi:MULTISPECIES: DNA gyrase/topoisomerase IV subunit A [unclassified Pedobacter]|uniref:DNA gyrase/topoisomerase IV subunit A n=1 Tax=unclassified Pedobacter TaxID=2628915 RepID=UPI001DFD834B|nr:MULTISPECIES: DNA gyrase/topoisomerase IV subunit A [unclassified Pedobacter]CAH0252579.1 DNA gyrase subunit A [Pedobacter sp. Bi36]CAH0277275.1 DNA gyrase subunit A [Pedobacter sp. Bi126]